VGVDSFEIHLLGPVRVTRAGRELAIGGRRQRGLLALLVLERGRPVSREKLADELWQGRPPAGFETALRSYVSRLRGVLGESASLIGGGAAYSLEVQPDAESREKQGVKGAPPGFWRFFDHRRRQWLPPAGVSSFTVGRLSVQPILCDRW